MKKNWIFLYGFLCIFFSIFYQMAAASEMDDAEKSASEILTLIGTRNYDEIWNDKACAEFRKVSTRSAFLSYMAISRNALPPMSNTPKLVSSYYATVSGNPSAPGEILDGKFYSFTYETTYGSYKYYENINVMMDSDGIFRFWGISGAPRS